MIVVLCRQPDARIIGQTRRAVGNDIDRGNKKCGLTVERSRETVDFYGNDVLPLVGGSLLAAADALLERTQSFVHAVHSAAVMQTVPGALSV